MPGIKADKIEVIESSNELYFSHLNEISASKCLQSEILDISDGNCPETTIEQLYENVCEMESSTNVSPSQESFRSEGDESRIDSELCHLVGGETKAVETLEGEVNTGESNVIEDVENGGTSSTKSEKRGKVQSPGKLSTTSKKSKKFSLLQIESNDFMKTGIRSKVQVETSQTISENCDQEINPINLSVVDSKLQNGSRIVVHEARSDSPEVGQALLKHARDLIRQDNPRRAMMYALRASKVFEKSVGVKSRLDLTMSLHVLAAIHCSLGQYELAVPVLERSLEIPTIEEGHDHALAKFSGHMQLGDTYAMLGQTNNSLRCYATGLEVQKRALGDADHRVAETYRYLAEAHVQALQLVEAERLCQAALDLHKKNGTPSCLEETADRRLMGLICHMKGDYEGAVEQLVLASLSMTSGGGRDIDLASVDCSIGDAYLSLARYDEAVFSYQKAVSMFKSEKGENHPIVASVFVRLAYLYNKVGKIKESRNYCENALKIYGKQLPGTSPEEIATGLTDVSAIFESMNENEEALKLLKKALKIYNNLPCHLSTIAGIEAQMGVLYYVIGKYEVSYNSLKSGISMFRASGETKSAFFGVALNQLGLVCIHLQAINEAAELFEEARIILEQEYGPYHPDTLGAYSNLAGTYDAMGRLNEAIEILDYIVGIREDRLGTANPDVEDEKRRLAELLKETGRVRGRKNRSLETLLDTYRHNLKKSMAE